MKATTLLFVVILSVCLSRAMSGSMRNLSEIRYHFTTCGQRGSAGPEYEQCLAEYNRMKSPITDEGLLVNLESLQRGSDYYQGAQRFKVPRTGFYNVTVAGAAGGRGVCSTTSGRGLLWTGTVLLHEEQDLLILVGQQGLGPCDEEVSLERPLPLCSNPPANLSDVQSCQTEWVSWINSDPMLPVNQGPFVQAIIGGGSGGGASFILPVFRANESFNSFPIVIAPGGAGSAAEERQDIFDEIDKPSPANVSSEEQLLLLINGQTSSYPSYDMFARGSRGFINESASSATARPGAGGGWGAASASTLSEGHAIGIESQFALGGQDCAIRLRGSFTPYVPILNVNGGFGGGGSQCAGGGAGGGYTGGSVVFSRFYIPGGGGYFLGPEEAGYDTNNFIENSLELNTAQLDGFVKIIPMDCGCSYDCIVYDETFECVCPTGFNLTPNQVDCFQVSELTITEEATASFGNGLYYKYVEIENSTFIYSNDLELQSSGELEMCVLFWLGKNSQIVLATNMVRGNGRINSLAVLDDTGVAMNTMFLNSSVLVTGALLVGTGNCTVVGNSIVVSSSNRIPSISAVNIIDFRSNRSSEVEQNASVIANRLFEDENIAITEVGITVIPVVSTLVAVFILCAIISLAILFLLTYKCYIRKRRSTPIMKKISKNFTSKTTGHNKSNGNSFELESTPKGCCNPKNQMEFNFKVDRISYKDINFVKIIGKGEFGIVYLAEITFPHNGEKQSVAVKTIKGSFDHDEVVQLEKECRIICHLDHPNVLPLIGVCLDEKVPYLIMPLMERGSLLAYLRRERDSLLLKESDEDQISITRKRLLDMCYQIAKGMEYITRLDLVHRDLAARNCMVDLQGKIRVSDFGLSESIYTKTYLRLENHKDLKFPVKWSAPESISDGIFSEETDIWSFGVTCWEVFSAGKNPYPGIHPLNVINMVEEGYRMEKPKNLACPDKMYALMMECWNADSTRRPTFSDLVQTICYELELLSDYLTVTIGSTDL